MLDDILSKLLSERELATKKVEDVLRCKAGLERGDVHEVAEFLHRRLCAENHTASCSWWFSEWGQYPRKQYLQKAEELLAIGIQHNIKPVILFEMSDILMRPLT